MITKKLIDKIKLSRNKDGKLNLKYDDKQLAVISEKVLFQMILDSAPASFLNELAKVAGVEEKPKHSNAVIKFATAYAVARFAYTGKKFKHTDIQVINLRDRLLADKKVVVNFKKAIELMVEIGQDDVNKFIQGQVEGLKFVNDGKGVFPKPNQLFTANAVNRAIEYTSESVDDNNVSNKKVEKPKHYWFFNQDIDGSLTLDNNPKYKEALDKITNGTASMDEALYAKKCFSHRRSGSSYDLIEKHIKKISR